ncbi:MAG: hypothetical protein ACRCSN_19720 [Dermatophilaceae bacterium]
MPLTLPLTPDITESLPALLSARQVSADAASSGVLFDVVISGVGFTSAMDSQNPYQRETVPIQKQQIDTSQEAGEQSLDGYWIRSQTSWHLGAGATYYEPAIQDGDGVSKHRFSDSRGVNVWNRGEVSLLARMDAGRVTNPADVSVCGGRYAGVDVYYSFSGTTIQRHASAGGVVVGTAASSTASVPIVTTGKYILTGSTTGVYKTDVDTGVTTAAATQAAGVACRPWWVKSRVIAARANELHQVTLAGGPIDSTSLMFTHPDPDWVWSGVVEAPDAILASGYSGGASGVFAFALEDANTGSVPRLGQGYQVAEMPMGEEIRSMVSYLGTYVGLGTTSGPRVGLVGERGRIQYGPVLVRTPLPVVCMAARGEFVYAATGNSVIRVSLAEQVDSQDIRFPYAYDVEVPSAQTVTSLAFLGASDRVAVGCNGQGTYLASGSQYVASGWIRSGTVRYGSTAAKAFRSVDVDVLTPGTSRLAVSAVARGSQVDIVTLAGGKSGEGVSLSALPAPLAEMSLLLTLTAGNGVTPTLNATAIRAVPTPKRQRLIKYPVWVVDRPRDARNQPFGREGYAAELLAALEGLEDSQMTVTVKDLTRPEQFEAVIERVDFTRVQPRTPGTGEGNFGGWANVVVKTL